MPSNVEIKAKATNFARQMSLAAKLADSEPQLLEQCDTFFEVPRGRLKLRECGGRQGELIQYDRQDLPEAKVSSYAIVRTDDPEGLKAALSNALGVRGVVRKQRWLYLVGRTRIHFDEVEGLGHFIELEVVMSPDEPVSAGQRVAALLMDRLEIGAADLIDCAYIDLTDRDQC